MTNIPYLDEIKDWIQENPQSKRNKLCEHFKIDNDFAYRFAKKHPQYRYFVKHFINESEWAYYWAWHLGNKRFMMNQITSSEWAYEWACNIGNLEFMKQHISEEQYAFYWARRFGDLRYMKQFINTPYWAFKWGYELGDKDEMIFIIKQGTDDLIKMWNQKNPNHKIEIDNV